MGRPINKRYFGVAGVGPTAGSTEIKVNFHNGTAVKEGYIVKQLGSKKFRVEEIETSGTFDCTLTTGKLPAALAAGEMSISSNSSMNSKYGRSSSIHLDILIIAILIGSCSSESNNNPSIEPYIDPP